MIDDFGGPMAEAQQTETIAPGTAGNVPPPAAPRGTDHPMEGSGPLGATAQGVLRKRWYAIEHHPFMGGYTRLSIRKAGFRVHWPREMVRDRRRDDMLVPLFRPYLFVEFDRDRPWTAVRRATGVVTILGIREFGAPMPARPGSVERLIRMAGGEDDGWIDATGDRFAELPSLAAGDVLASGAEVEILHDALFGKSAVIGLDRGRANVEVMMQMFGMECRTKVARSKVKPRDAA